MRNRPVGVLVLILCASACDDSDPVVADAGATTAQQPSADLTLTSTASAKPQALRAEYKAIHTYATLRNSVATGQRIDGLLSDKARELIAREPRPLGRLRCPAGSSYGFVTRIPEPPRG